MWTLGPVAFASPWLLLGLPLLPILWILLRTVPPAPVRRLFPGVALLLGLADDEVQTDRTPWWLLLLRMLAVAAAIVGFADPVLTPRTDTVRDGPLLLLFDGSWADAPNWSMRNKHVESLLADAALDGRETAVVSLADLPPHPILPFRSARNWLPELPGFAPRPWMPDGPAVLSWLAGLDGSFDTFWLSDGIAQDWRSGALAALQARGHVSVFESRRPVLALKPARIGGGKIQVPASRSRSTGASAIAVVAHGLDPVGIERELARVDIEFPEGEREAEAVMSLPPELTNRLTRFEIEGVRSAGAVSLTDDSFSRHEIAIISAREEREGSRLLSPTHYLEQALRPSADLIRGAIQDIVLANPDVIVLADVASLAGGERNAVEEWVRNGGLLLRFAGPRLAASDIGREAEDVLLPVRLRAGGRRVGGAMSWGEPKQLRDFSAASPFFGLDVPDDVAVSSQVVAQPDPNMAERTIATLADGTPLVTRKRLGNGQVVLFHVTANADWSNLPLSGLFVQMLERLAVSTRQSLPVAEDLEGTVWTLDQRLDGFGNVDSAGPIAGVDGARLVTESPGPDLPPGIYAGESGRIALNAFGKSEQLAAAAWPVDVPVEELADSQALPLKGPLLLLTILAFLVDVLATLLQSGRMPRVGAVTGGAVAAVLWTASPAPAQEQDFERLVTAASEVTLAHVITGDAAVDRVAAAGLRGLSNILLQRTSVEPGDPVGVNLETDELSVLPYLYWPVTETQQRPSAKAYEKLNQYLRAGGLIHFDTRDAGVARFGSRGSNASRLRQLAMSLDVPPLEPIPHDHVLTRSFYLLQDFPGRYASRDVWVEAAPADALQAEGMPFRNLNDNVTPVVIGGNDWAAAWAMDARGRPMFPVGRGFSGERQREIAYRFGVNLIMYVLTGNYKSDQVHVPALLDRLGQ
ncbi:MAG: DUF4159 domain-containing protein [Boseongicola sp. SB0670_bin_30]|nr:DUF4159 domain-containing protein [Boseongicola sp. SB0670_bin_30]